MSCSVASRDFNIVFSQERAHGRVGIAVRATNLMPHVAGQ